MSRCRAFLSIRSRITALFTVAIGFVLLSASLLSAVDARRTIEKRADASLASMAHKIAGDLTSDEGRIEGADVIEEEAQALRAQRIDILVLNADGTERMKSLHSGLRWPEPRHGWRIATASAGELTVVAGTDWRVESDRLADHEHDLIAFALVGTLCAGAGCWASVGRTLRPIAQVAAQARERASTPGQRLVAPSNDAEVVGLVTTLNELLDAVETNIGQRERFYAAAAHELRTPLQALSGHLELALTKPRSSEDYRDTLHEAILQTDRLTALCTDLLHLNRLQDGSDAGDMEEVELRDLCQEAVDALRFLPGGTRVSITGSASALANRSHLGIVLRNLVDNAVRYADNNTPIQVHLREDSQGAVVVVENSAAPLDSADIERLEEPFFRAGSARGGPPGSGLGLAICRAIVDGDGWHMAIVQSGRRVCVTLRVPPVVTRA